MFPCAVLCGGLATRLRPITEKIPKSLISINSEPFIAHQLRLLHSQGIGRVVLCVGHLGEMIQAVVANGAEFGLDVSYSYDGDRLLGTAGAIRKALPLLDSSFFVLYGDSYLPCNYSAVAQAFSNSQLLGLMTIYNNGGKYDSSNVEAEQGRILTYDKQNRSARMQYIDYGLGMFNRSVFEVVDPAEVRDLAQTYQQLLAAGQLAAFEVPERFYEVGSTDGILDFQLYLSKKISPADAPYLL